MCTKIDNAIQQPYATVMHWNPLVRVLKVLMFMLGILMFIFGFIMFIAEMFHNSKFDNVFVAMYLALITLTTVGYGDYYPNTVLGHIIASTCSVCGVLIIALPIGIIASSYYT
jgi:ABC-type phosphate transport system permease subunit